MNKAQIKQNIIHLIHHRQKQADMHIIQLTGRQAAAISNLKRQIELREKADDNSFIIMVRSHISDIQSLMPGPHSTFFRFRERIQDMLKVCQP